MATRYEENHTHRGYCAGHPWYYLLGGRVLTPKQIRNSVRAGTYRGYRAEEIQRLAKLSPPKRTIAVSKIKAEVMVELQADISRYRRCVFELHEYRNGTDESAEPISCSDIHVSVSLKHNHIVNGFAHLALIDELPKPSQGDLFGF